MVYPDTLLRNQLVFQNRQEAGLLLSRFLNSYQAESPIILGIPRGGVSIAYQVSKSLSSPLDVIVSTKIPSPDRPELPMGAVSENSVVILDSSVINLLGYEEDQIQEALRTSIIDIEKRITLYRGSRSLDLDNKTVIIVDDGLSSGAMALAAITAVTKMSPKKIIYATPVCNYNSAVLIRSRVNEFVCLSSPQTSVSASFFYHEFDQVTDQEVLLYVRRNTPPHSSSISNL